MGLVNEGVRIERGYSISLTFRYKNIKIKNIILCFKFVNMVYLIVVWAGVIQYLLYSYSTGNDKSESLRLFM